MGGVHQHDAAEAGGGAGGHDRATEAPCHQHGDAPGVVDVGVGQQHRIHIPRQHRQGGVFVDVSPLLHAAVDENAVGSGLQQGAGAGDLVGGA